MISLLIHFLFIPIILIVYKYNSKPSAENKIKMVGKYGFNVNGFANYNITDFYENYYQIRSEKVKNKT